MKNAETEFMEGLLGSLNDIEDATGSVVVSKESYDETRQLLEGLNDVGLEYGNLLNPQDSPHPKSSYNENHYDVQSRMDQLYSEPVHQAPVYKAEPVIKTNWSLVESIAAGTKNTKTYSIKSNHSSQVIMSGIMMYEAALTLVNLLNEGRMITDTKILGIISSGLQYTKVMNEVIDASRQRQRVLNESKYDKAKELDAIISEKKMEAVKLKERVLTFLVQEGYITK